MPHDYRTGPCRGTAPFTVAAQQDQLQKNHPSSSGRIFGTKWSTKWFLVGKPRRSTIPGWFTPMGNLSSVSGVQEVIRISCGLLRSLDILPQVPLQPCCSAGSPTTRVRIHGNELEESG